MNGSIKLTQYSPSNKGTESTMPMQFKPSPEKQKNLNELYKQDSRYSDNPIMEGQMKDQFLKLKNLKLKQHDELRKFLRKADQINQISYLKLQKDRPYFPKNTNPNIYKSNKNIVEEIGRSKDEKIKRIYLPQKKEPSKSVTLNPKTHKKNYSSFEKKKEKAPTKQIQTQRQFISHNTRYPTGLKVIEEDKDEDFALERKKKQKLPNKIFNTIALTTEIKKNRAPNLPEFQKKYQLRKTMFNTPETKIQNTPSITKQIANNTYVNFWENDEVNLQTVQKEEKKSEKKIHKKLAPIVNESKRDIAAEEERSLIVEENESKRKTEFSDFFFNKQSRFQTSHQASLVKVNQKQDIKQISIQFPEVPELLIGESKNEQHQIRKPTHPISIDFSNNDATWITQNYKPKSQFLRHIDFKNFQMKKYRNGVYFGQLSGEGQKHGKGVIFYFNGRSYEGNFVNDLKQGKGFESFPDGSKYTGEFKNGFKEGKGIFQWSNGELYDGQWIAGKKNGSGMWKGVDGDSYIGEWKKGKVEGFGVFVSEQGDRYEGEFKCSKKHGLGTERYVSGDIYVGLFEKNRPNGQGQLYYKNGDLYKGSFSNGLRHGEGFLKTQTSSYKGEYQNDKKCGYGQLTCEEGCIYVGNFENDLKHGYGEEYLNQKCIFKGYWLNNDKVSDEKTPGQSKKKQKGKLKIKSKEKSPKQQRKKSIELQLSPSNVERACGCRRKH